MATPRLHRRAQGEEEDASILKLGPGPFLVPHFFRVAVHLKNFVVEFNNAGCLLISEVKYLLENRDKDAPDTPYAFIVAYSEKIRQLTMCICSVYNKTLEYVRQFAKFTTTDSASAVRE